MKAVAGVALVIALSSITSGSAHADVLSDQLQQVEARSHERSHHRLRIAAVLVASVGAASIVVGAAHGIGAILDWHEVSDSHDCDRFHVCDADGIRLTARSQSLARASDLLLGSGVAVVAVAAGLWLSARDVRITPVIAPGTSGAVVSTSF